MNNEIFYWPLKEKLALKKNKAEITLASFLIKKDIKLKHVKSLFNLPYSKENNPCLTFDVHTPTNFLSPMPCIIYFHGGALLSGDKSIYTSFLKKLCKLGFVVFNVNYSLMPEVEIENIVSNCACAVKHIVKNCKKFNINPQKIVMGGDSAGAYLASFLITQFQNKNFKTNPPIKFCGCFLYYGLFDLTKFNKSKFPIIKSMHSRYVKLFDKYEKQEFDKINPNKKFVSCAKNFKKSNLYAYYKSYSTTTYLTSKFPPTFVASGKIDKLHNQTKLFVEKLKENNVPVTAVIFARNRVDARHAFLNVEFLPSAKTAFATLKEFLQKIK